MIPLPIDQIREPLKDHLKAHSRAILIATPGSGKSTRIPFYLYSDLKPKGKIIVLQPRRAAAMMLAKRVSEETQTALMDLVGYQVKGDSKVSEQTRIIYMTPGVF